MSDLYRLADTEVESQLDGAELRWVIPVAIDCEAATEALRREHQRIHNIMDADDYWGYLTDLATVAVDAAIGDTDRSSSQANDMIDPDYWRDEIDPRGIGDSG